MCSSDLPQMDLSGLFRVQQMDKQDFNDILGYMEIMQGKAPSGIEAGVALEMLAESANTRIRLKVRLMEGSIRRTGELLLKFVQKYYTAQRTFRIVGSEFGDDGSIRSPQFFSINQPAGIAADEAGNNIPQFDETSNQIPPDAEFDIRIGAGSTLPVSRTARFQQGITLFDRKAIDRLELLKAAAWPNYEKVDQRMREAEEAAMAMQMGGQLPPDAEAMIQIGRAHV